MATVEANPARMSRRLVAVLAVATGASVANMYYAQPLLPLIRRDLHLTAGVAGLVVTVTQVGYAFGLVLLLPLGDLLERRRLIAVTSVAVAFAMAWFGLSPGAGSLLAAAFVVGVLSVVAQILVPFAARLAGPGERGRVVGTVMSGLLVGVLLARTVAGALAEAGSWRFVYWAGAGLMLIQAAVLRRALPRHRERLTIGYPGLLRSLGALIVAEPVLRRRAVYGALSFAAFSVLWTSLAFLLAAPPFRYGPAAIGLFGLAGAAGALTASAAGRLADRGTVRLNTAVAVGLLCVAYFPLWLGRHSVAWLLLGIVLLDIGAQGLHITNQSEIYRLRSEANSRVNSVYMTMYFAGGAAGSAVSAFGYGTAGWAAVCLAGGSFAALALLFFGWDSLRPLRTVR
jgi:predicted MFS family arabinose efflux permease